MNTGLSKKLTGLLTVLVLLPGMMSCGKTPTVKPELQAPSSPAEGGHTHKYDAVVTMPGCAEQGYTTYTCACGDCYVSDATDATGAHVYESGSCTLCGEAAPIQSVSMQYDDHWDAAGKTVQILSENPAADAAVVTLEDNTLIATGIGTAQVTIDDQPYEITVNKAKINIIVIMGQSNAGNYFENATSDVVCPMGTAYWWGNGRSYLAKEPVPYCKPSMGFHTPLLAELYAQSVAAGDPVKNVMIWQEDITCKSGDSIVKWAASPEDTRATNPIATMIRNCIAYYEYHSDTYEIVDVGVYWLQGEADVFMEPEQYSALFMAMWNKLREAGADYLAFLRVRKGMAFNDEYHEDLSYSGALTAQLDMANRNPDMFMASTITENWTGSADVEHHIDIRNYLTLMEAYGHSEYHEDDYGNRAAFRDGILTTPMQTLFGSNNRAHYGKFGYGIMGADAAYSMYRALHSRDFSIVKSDTSGKAQTQLVSQPGDVVTLDITWLEENLAFRASCGSTAGTLEVTVKSGRKNVTDWVIARDVNTFATVDTEALRRCDNPVITVTYTPVQGTAGSVTYNITDRSLKHSSPYDWGLE